MLPMTRNFWRIYTTGIKKIFEFSYCCFFKTRYGKKIWLTEFAKPSTMSSQAELNYMKEILPYLEGSNHIWRYSWFVNRYIHLTCYYNQTLICFTYNTYFHFFRFTHHGSGHGWYLDRAISLLEADKSRLTKLGKYYNGFKL